MDKVKECKMKTGFGRQLIDRFFLRSFSEDLQLTRFAGKGG
jgi:hypothetical protein